MLIAVQWQALYMFSSSFFLSSCSFFVTSLFLFLNRLYVYLFIFIVYLLPCICLVNCFCFKVVQPCNLTKRPFLHSSYLVHFKKLYLIRADYFSLAFLSLLYYLTLFVSSFKFLKQLPLFINIQCNITEVISAPNIHLFQRSNFKGTRMQI